LLSACLVNDIVCLVMTPFMLRLTRRFGLAPIPYLLAVALASNIGSAATITGNPQNVLIGSMSRISYLVFVAHLGPIAVAGLFLTCSGGSEKRVPLCGSGKPLTTVRSSITAGTFLTTLLRTAVAGTKIGMRNRFQAAIGCSRVAVNPARSAPPTMMKRPMEEHEHP
jgi:hypothetical protein